MVLTKGTNAYLGGNDVTHMRNITDGPADEKWLLIFDIYYVYRQLQLSVKALNVFIFAVTCENFSRYTDF